MLASPSCRIRGITSRVYQGLGLGHHPHSHRIVAACFPNPVSVSGSQPASEESIQAFTNFFVDALAASVTRLVSNWSGPLPPRYHSLPQRQDQYVGAADATLSKASPHRLAKQTKNRKYNSENPGHLKVLAAPVMKYNIRCPRNDHDPHAQETSGHVCRGEGNQGCRSCMLHQPVVHPLCMASCRKYVHERAEGGTGSTVLSPRKHSLGDLSGNLILACEVRLPGHPPVTKQRVWRGSDHVGCACTTLRVVFRMHAVLIGHPKLTSMAVPCSHGQGEQGF